MRRGEYPTSYRDEDLGTAVSHRALSLCQGAAQAAWTGPDPYDGLWWRWPAPLTSGRRRRQLIMQAHVRSPVDIRRVYRRTHPRLAKTLALFASASMRLVVLGHEGALPLANRALLALDQDRRAGPDAWGYPFDVQTRWSFYPKSEPSIVPTAFAVMALLEAAQLINRREFEDRARRGARWVVDSLWLEKEGFFAYHPYSTTNIHNANMLGARLAWEALGNDVRRLVLRAVDRTVAGQRPDGSWPYGEGEAGISWADSFHTGYVLISLLRLRVLDSAIDDAIARGARFYERFFGPRGESRLWSNRLYPEDGHSAGTGLTALAALVHHDQISPDLLQRVAQRVLTHGFHGGHAIFRRYRGGLRSYVYYPRWCDGHVALGLSDTAMAVSGRESAVGAAELD